MLNKIFVTADGAYVYCQEGNINHLRLVLKIQYFSDL